MGALLISAVDATANTLTITAHGLNTGDGFLAMFATDGSTLPGGTAAVTDYWAIKVDANTVKLATSSANAFAGTAVDITTTGSGTLYLLQGLPYRVPRIASSITQKFSTDDNSTWQSIVALWNFLTGQAQTTYFGDLVLPTNRNMKIQGTGKYKRGTRTRKVAPINGKLGGSAAAVSAGSPAFYDGRVQFTVDGDLCVVGLVLNDDEQLTAVRANLLGDTSMTLSMKIFATTAATGAGQLGSTATSSAAASDQTLSSGALTETIVAGDKKLYVATFHATTAAAIKVLLGEIEYDTIVP